MADVRGYPKRSVVLENGDGDDISISNPLPAAQTVDMFTQAALGLLPGVTPVVMRGNNTTIGTSYENIWDQGGLYTYLTASTSLYISSTSTGDTQTLSLTYLDDQYVQKTATAVLNGQTQVLIATDVFRVINIKNVSLVDLAGNVYLAESATLTGGVPNTSSKIKDRIGLINGSGMSRNTSLTSIYTVPAGKTLIIHNFYIATKKGDDLTSTFRFRPVGKSWYSVADAHVFEAPFSLPTSGVFTIPEKTDIEVIAKSSMSSASADTATYGLLYTN